MRTWWEEAWGRSGDEGWGAAGSLFASPALVILASYRNGPSGAVCAILHLVCHILFCRWANECVHLTSCDVRRQKEMWSDLILEASRKQVMLYKGDWGTWTSWSWKDRSYRETSDLSNQVCTLWRREGEGTFSGDVFYSRFMDASQMSLKGTLLFKDTTRIHLTNRESGLKCSGKTVLRIQIP